MTRVRIAAVSYLNTIPFLYGIEHSDFNLSADLLLSPPAGCAEALSRGDAEIGLIPVAEIPRIENIDIITPYCIGASASVRTVVLLSDSPYSDITDIYLDPHSRTSAALIKIVARELWSINPVWHPIDDYADIAPRPGVGYMIIGDKVFDYEHRFRYNYDLADEWRDLTGLPFVFAAWVARKGIAQRVVEQLSDALKFGVDHIEQAVKTYPRARIDHDTAVDYLTNNIDFNFDSRKREALKLFWKLLNNP